MASGRGLQGKVRPAAEDGIIKGYPEIAVVQGIIGFPLIGKKHGGMQGFVIVEKIKSFFVKKTNRVSKMLKTT